MLHLVIVMVVKFAVFSSILYHYMQTKFMKFMDSEIFGLWFSNVNTVSLVHICDTRLYPPSSVIAFFLSQLFFLCLLHFLFQFASFPIFVG